MTSTYNNGTGHANEPPKYKSGGKRRTRRKGKDERDDEDGNLGKQEVSARSQEENIFNKHKELINALDAVEFTDSDPKDSDDIGPETKKNLLAILTKECKQGYVQKPDQKTKSTLLHKLSLGYSEENDRNRDYVAEYLLKKYPELLHAKDSSEQTPLSQAIESDDSYFVESILGVLSPEEQIRALTETVGAGGLTCLTLAFKRQVGTHYDLLDTLLGFSEPTVLVTPDEKGNTPLHYLVQNSEFGPNALMEYLTQLLERGPKAMEITNKTEKETPYQARQSFLGRDDRRCVVKAPNVDTNGQSKSKVKYRFRDPAHQDDRIGGISDEVSELLKKHCMMKNCRIEEVLYKPGQEQRSVYLDLTSYHEQTIAYEKLTYMANPAFETILQFVRIPQIIIDSPPPDPKTPSDNRPVREIRRKRAPKQRRDVEYVFRWLKEQGVITILEVEVTDFGGTGIDCHSDEVIERALSPFEVVVWNWKRYDICSGTILTAAPKVQELYLYSRGNPAILYGWSCEDGLGRLQELRTIRLIVHPELDSEERAERNLSKFEERMKKLYPKIKVDARVDISGNLGLGQSRNEEDAVQSSDRWLDTMRAWASYTLTFSPAPNPRIKERPVVAILDDGVDVMRDDIKDRLIGGQSFKGADGKKRYSGYQGRPGCHGTIMASLVLKMCPQATILPIRLDTRSSAKRGGPPCFTIKSAAEAVKWATLQDVDIISMSWSIEAAADENREELEHLKSALAKAAEKNIILFCATSDKGNATPDNLYPGCVPMIISIGAATSTGEVSAIVRSRNVQFIFPGEAVEIDGKKNTADGSSIATALAAGMAAMLLHCADKVMPENVRKDYHTHAAILRAFRRMGGTPESAPRVKEHFSYEDHKNWQQKLNTGEWRDSLKLKMLEVGIIERSHYEDNNALTDGVTRIPSLATK